MLILKTVFLILTIVFLLRILRILRSLASRPICRDDASELIWRKLASHSANLPIYREDSHLRKRLEQQYALNRGMYEDMLLFYRREKERKAWSAAWKAKAKYYRSRWSEDDNERRKKT